jgi:hypothetical protein
MIVGSGKLINFSRAQRSYPSHVICETPSVWRCGWLFAECSVRRDCLLSTDESTSDTLSSHVNSCSSFETSTMSRI